MQSENLTCVSSSILGDLQYLVNGKYIDVHVLLTVPVAWQANKRAHVFLKTLFYDLTQQLTFLQFNLEAEAMYPSQTGMPCLQVIEGIIQDASGIKYLLTFGLNWW